ncbi:MAG: cobalamin-dependent protein [Candidatus Humimicrobiaceae bacterium]
MANIAKGIIANIAGEVYKKIIGRKDKDMKILDKIFKATQQGDYKNIKSLAKEALDEGIEAKKIISGGLAKAMVEVGDKFAAGDLFMPDMLLSAKTMKEAMSVLGPVLKEEGEGQARGTLVIGTVKGDLHDIGKNLVITMAEGQGFKVVDLGIDVDYPTFVEAINKNNPDIVAFSGLLTTTLANISEHIKAIEDANLRDKVVLAVGGAPVTRDFADRYGIEIYADDASTAAKEFVKAVKN